MLSQLYRHSGQVGNDMLKRKNPLNNGELIVLLEEIKENAILSKALDEYEAKELSNKIQVP